jgi:hypothetical protein
MAEDRVGIVALVGQRRFGPTVAEPVHPATPEERELTRLNIALINTDDPGARASITNAIYTSELQINTGTLTQDTIAHPVHLNVLQRSLSPNALLIEYVLPLSSAWMLDHQARQALDGCPSQGTGQ